MSAFATPAERPRAESALSGIAELTLQTDDLPGWADFHSGRLGLPVLDRSGDRVWLAVGERNGDRSLHFADPAGNLVELWDFVKRGQGAREGVGALA